MWHLRDECVAYLQQYTALPFLNIVVFQPDYTPQYSGSGKAGLERRQHGRTVVLRRTVQSHCNGRCIHSKTHRQLFQIAQPLKRVTEGHFA